VKPFKDAAPPEVAALKRRTIRSLAMGQIPDASCTFITIRLDEIAAHIVEISNNEEEV
jgi:hypothetical protein